MKPVSPSHASKLAAALGAVLVLLIGPLAGAAFAHAALQESNPADGATLSAMPAQIQLTLNEPVRPPAFVVVTDTAGTRMNSEQVDVAEKTVTTRITAPAAGGEYTVAYRIVSADAHPVNGELRFNVTAPASAAPTPTPTPAPENTTAYTADESAFDDQLIIVVFAALLGIGVITFMIRGIRARDSE